MSEVAVNGVEEPLVGSTFPLNEKSPNQIVLKLPLIRCPKTGSGSDDDLTNLNWLQDANLIKNINGDQSDGTEADSNSNLTNEMFSGCSNEPFGCEDINTFVPYNPNVHTDAKPPYSFSCLIFMAIEHSKNKALPVKDIYLWMLTNFPYFQKAPSGWKNSVRHNLSLNKCFRKVDANMRPSTMVKGCYWRVDKQFRPHLLQALKRSSYQPYHHVFVLANSANGSDPEDQSTEHRDVSKCKEVSSGPSPDLFPFLSKKLQETENKTEPEVDAAATMLAMKNGNRRYDPPDQKPSNTSSCITIIRRKNIKWHDGSRKRKSSTPVVTMNPSGDHTYSSCCISKSECSNDGDQKTVCDKSNERQSESRLCDTDNKSWNDDILNNNNNSVDLDEEEQKIAEGADALLNLAGITKRSRRLARRSIRRLKVLL